MAKMFSYNPLTSSIEKIPKPRSCDSLRLATIVTALIAILYSVVGLRICTAALINLPPHLSTEDKASMMMFAVVILATIMNGVLLVLSIFLLFGAVKEKKFWIRPWVTWMSIQVMALMLWFIFWSTMLMITQYGNNSLGDYLKEFVMLLMKFYMLTVVMSYYRHLEQTEGETERIVKLMNSEVWKI